MGDIQNGIIQNNTHRYLDEEGLRHYHQSLVEKFLNKASNSNIYIITSLDDAGIKSTPTGGVYEVKAGITEITCTYTTAKSPTADLKIPLKNFTLGDIIINETLSEPDLWVKQLYSETPASELNFAKWLYLKEILIEDVRSIVNIVKTSTEGLVDTYTITYSDTTTSTFTVTNGANGEDGHTPTITVGENGNWFVDGVDTGQKAQGNDGNGITEITGPVTSGLVDTYTIHYSNGTESTFTVTNGKDGEGGGGTVIEYDIAVSDTEPVNTETKKYLLWFDTSN